jgi:hypothetical protein
VSNGGAELRSARNFYNAREFLIAGRAAYNMIEGKIDGALF